MMNNKMKIVTAVLAFSLVASSAFAAQGNGKGNQPVKPTRAEKKADVKAKVDPEATVTASVYADGEGHNGAKGLLNALSHVVGTPAAERIAELLRSKYDIEVDVDAEASAIVDELEASGELEAAAEVQAEVTAADPTNIEHYVKLGKLKIKLGHKGVKAYVNGKEPKLDVPPVILEGRTLVPFRAVAESLDAEVKWDSATKTVVVLNGDVEVKLVLGSEIAWINGEAVTLDVAAETINNRVLVPLRFLGEALEADVKWEAETKSVVVVGKEA